MISELRANHLAHLIREDLKLEGHIQSQEDMQVLQMIKKGVQAFVTTHKEVDRLARLQISNQKKNILEGSMEWEVLYGRFYEQELKRKGL